MYNMGDFEHALVCFHRAMKTANTPNESLQNRQNAQREGILEDCRFRKTGEVQDKPRDKLKDKLIGN